MTGATGDITEQKALARKLEEAQVRLNEAIEAISEGFVLYNADMELVICNSVYRALLPGRACTEADSSLEHRRAHNHPRCRRERAVSGGRGACRRVAG